MAGYPLETDLNVNPFQFLGELEDAVHIMLSGSTRRVRYCL